MTTSLTLPVPSGFMHNPRDAWSSLQIFVAYSQRRGCTWRVLLAMLTAPRVPKRSFAVWALLHSCAAFLSLKWPAQDPPEDDVPPMDTFCVLVLDPTEVDHLQLRENERREHRSTVAEDGTRQWSVQNVNV